MSGQKNGKRATATAWGAIAPFSITVTLITQQVTKLPVFFRFVEGEPITE